MIRLKPWLMQKAEPTSHINAFLQPKHNTGIDDGSLSIFLLFFYKNDEIHIHENQSKAEIAKLMKSVATMTNSERVQKI
jgi:hypothetical protein